jgi:CIC family chloride channel protein
VATNRTPVDAGYVPPLPYGRNVQLLRLLGLAVMVGILGALAVLAFHQLLLALETAMYGSNQGLVADATHLAPEIRVIVPALGGLAAGLVL